MVEVGVGKEHSSSRHSAWRTAPDIKAKIQGRDLDTRLETGHADGFDAMACELETDR
jgi:hypothetical protein